MINEFKFEYIKQDGSSQSISFSPAVWETITSFTVNQVEKEIRVTLGLKNDIDRDIKIDTKEEKSCGTVIFLPGEENTDGEKTWVETGTTTTDGMINLEKVPKEARAVLYRLSDSKIVGYYL